MPTLEGHYRQEHLFTLKQAVELVEFYQRQSTACDCQIEACLQQFAQKSREIPATTRRRKRRRGAIAFDAHSYLYRMTGVDLTQIDSIEANTALTVIGEIGLDMSRWPTEKHFGSWQQGLRRQTPQRPYQTLGQPSCGCLTSGSTVAQPKSVGPWCVLPSAQSSSRRPQGAHGGRLQIGPDILSHAQVRCWLRRSRPSCVRRTLP